MSEKLDELVKEYFESCEKLIMMFEVMKKDTRLYQDEKVKLDRAIKALHEVSEEFVKFMGNKL